MHIIADPLVLLLVLLVLVAAAQCYSPLLVSPLYVSLIKQSASASSTSIIRRSKIRIRGIMKQQASGKRKFTMILNGSSSSSSSSGSSSNSNINISSDNNNSDNKGEVNTITTSTNTRAALTTGTPTCVGSDASIGEVSNNSNTIPTHKIPTARPHAHHTATPPTAPSSKGQSKFFDRNILQQFLVETSANKEVMLHWEMGKFSLIYDKFPKARIHLLVVVSEQFIKAKSVKQLTVEHLPQIREIHTFITKVCDEITSNRLPSSTSIINGENSEKLHDALQHRKLKVGFHAIPSLYPLHIHILSNDLESSTMSTKKHWNSFTTPFFVELDEVINVLETNRNCDDFLRKDQDYEAMLKQSLSCHHCGQECNTIPALKLHLQNIH